MLVLILIPESEYETIDTSIHDSHGRDLCVRFICKHVRDIVVNKQQVNDTRSNQLNAMGLRVEHDCYVLDLGEQDTRVDGMWLGLIAGKCLVRCKRSSRVWTTPWSSSASQKSK